MWIHVSWEKVSWTVVNESPEEKNEADKQGWETHFKTEIRVKINGVEGIMMIPQSYETKIFSKHALPADQNKNLFNFLQKPFINHKVSKFNCSNDINKNKNKSY